MGSQESDTPVVYVEQVDKLNPTDIPVLMYHLPGVGKMDRKVI